MDPKNTQNAHTGSPLLLLQNGPFSIYFDTV
jgi:hypothetical protein